ncbi:MAG: ABC transporter substrate-binding protein [Thermodesulfobacteriota bacterium]
MFNNFLILRLKTLLVIFFPACLVLSSAQFFTKAYSQQTEDKEINEKVFIFNKSFGSILPLTGSYSVLGENAVRGISTAMKFSEFGSLYEMYLRDVGENDPNISNVYSSLVTKNDLSFILGPITTDSAKMISPLVDKYKVPTVTFPVFGDSVSGGENIIKFYYPIEDQVDHLVNYLINDLKLKKFAVLYPKTKFGIKFKDRFIENAKNKGGKFLHVSTYSQDLTGIEVEIDWIKPFKPDAIIIPDNPSRSASIISLFAKDENFINVLFVGPNTWNTKYFSDLLGNEVDGLIHKAIFTDYLDTESIEWKNFSEYYKSAYKDNPGIFEFQVYEVTKLLFSLDNNGDKKTSLFNKISNLESTSEYKVKKTNSGLEIYPKPYILSLEGNKFIVLK